MSSFHFQVPGGSGKSLLQVMTDESIGATGGGAIFAWATRSGLKALTKNPDFADFLSRSPFRLMVGTDSITDSRAIDALRELSDVYPRLDATAVLSDGYGLFHPKLAWFENAEFITLIVGSGNLTKGGLLGNWEAMSVNRIPISDREDLLASLDDWIESVVPGVLSLDDVRVAERVAGNSGDERTVRRPAKAPEPSVLTGADYSEWLIAELNRGRKSGGKSTFSQASFDKETFARFFNFRSGEVDVVLYPVGASGATGSLESRKGRFKAASQNYYFELGSAKGVPYPESGRPIAVFGRLREGGFSYTVVLPGEPGHAELSSSLNETVVVSHESRMRRSVVTTEELSGAWPGNPLLSAIAPAS